MNRVHRRTDGMLCQIEVESIEMMKLILAEFKPELVVEFGTLLGGFIKYIAEWHPDIPKYTVDAFWIVEQREADYFRSKNVGVLITGQLFNNEIILPILLSLPLRKFLMCDNGFKTQEVMKYAGHLRPGDILGVHDWTSEVDSSSLLNGCLSVFTPHKMNDEARSDCRFFVKKGYDEFSKYQENDIVKSRRH